MKNMMTIMSAAVLVSSFAFSANAATDAAKKVDDKLETSCKAQAAKKYSAIHFIKRRNYVKNCMGN